MFVPPAFTWTGFYVGVNAGGVWSNGGTSTTVSANGFPIGTISGVAATLADVFPGSNFGGSQTGFIGGGQAGYERQSGLTKIRASGKFLKFCAIRYVRSGR